MPKLIYIVGIGHNGSTLLDLILGQSKGVVSTSQLNDLTAPYYPSRATPKDRFWSNVLDTLSDGGRELSQQNRSVMKEKRILQFLLSRKTRRRFADANEELIKVIIDHTNCDVVVDSSKNVSRALGLLESSELDIYVVHLVRDLRGFVNSYNKRRREAGFKRQYLKPTLHWYSKNILASTAVRLKAANYKLLRYERFVDDPEKELTRLSNWIELSLSESIASSEKKLPIYPSQTLGFRGNRILNQEIVIFDPKRTADQTGVYRSKLFAYTLGLPARIFYPQATQRTVK